MKNPHIKDDEVEEDEEHMHHDAHDQLQLADNPSGVLQSVRQILALLVYLQWSMLMLESPLHPD